MQTGRTFCSQNSRIAGEELAGTAKPVNLWLMIEYRARWPREAREVFSVDLQNQIEGVRSRVPDTRIAFIKQPERVSGPLSVFWAFSREHGAELLRGSFSSYEKLSLDLDDLPDRTGESFYGVCTHGAHDLCCAQFGNKIYEEMRVHSADVWQVSHLGGCRFAPNVVCLPHGVVYGRVEKDDCVRIVSGYRNSRLLVEKLRGRSCFSKPVQAAEQFLMLEKDLTQLGDLALTGAIEIEPGRWRVTFAGIGARSHAVIVSLVDKEVTAYKSCSSAEPAVRRNFAITECNLEN